MVSLHLSTCAGSSIGLLYIALHTSIWFACAGVLGTVAVPLAGNEYHYSIQDRTYILQPVHCAGQDVVGSSLLLAGSDTGSHVLQFTFLQDDIGIPLNYRHMEGFGVHTFTLINKEGKITYVKFHWKPTCGVKNLLEEEAVTVGGSNHSHATKVIHLSCLTHIFCQMCCINR